MDPQSRQLALDKISPEDLKRIKDHQASTRGSYPVDQEWLLLAEFAMKFGWAAYLDVKHDVRENVTGEEMLTLIEASRKLDSLHLLRNSQASLIGAASAQSKKPGATFKSLTKDIIKDMKVDEL